MNARPKIDMMEATRLTREGRLEEAMAVLRGALPGAASSPAPAAARAMPARAGQAHADHSRHGAAVDRGPEAPGRRRSRCRRPLRAAGGHEPAADA